MPKVSVIIPTYNRANMLSRAIESVLGQTFSDLELIIVDDGSTDNTADIIKNFKQKDKRIKYFYQDNSGGAAKPKNKGIKEARGELIAILDSDDEWLSEKLEKQVGLFQKNKNIYFAGSDYYIVHSQKDEKEDVKVPAYENVFENILTRDYIGPGSGMMYRKKVFDRVGGFDENLRSGQDWDIRIRLAQEFQFGLVKEPLFLYYVHENRITDILGKDKIKDLDYIFQKHKKHYLRDRKIYSNKLRYDGTRFVLAGDLALGRKSFFQSIQKNFFNFKSYFYFLLSFLGRSGYYKLNKIKSIFNKLK